MDKNLDDSLNGAVETVVGPSVKIQGDLNSEGNIKIEGQVTGKVKTSQSLFVIPGAKVLADILAGNAVIGGEIQGNLKIAGHLVLQSTARILGDITCSVFRVEDGAQFTGKCVMGTNGNGKKLVMERINEENGEIEEE
ncbi:MAG TPA: polymer-forming cytoskeletal protein [Candidatus Limnocylindria bacterium]|nr:polymer-forming cytoskeletal protein [Candidatus Limnocylindria bacterium]